MDTHLPCVSGVEVARWIRVHHRKVGILMLTIYDDAPYVKAILQTGGNGYVLKTASPDETVQAIRDVYIAKSVLDTTTVKEKTALLIVD